MFTMTNPDINQKELFSPVLIYLLNRQTGAKNNFEYIDKGFYLTDENYIKMGTTCTDSIIEDNCDYSTWSNNWKL